MWKRPKISAPILGELLEGDPLPLQRKKLEQTLARTTTENEKDSINVCVCYLISYDSLFLSAYHKAVDSLFMLCFSPFDYY